MQSKLNSNETSNNLVTVFILFFIYYSTSIKQHLWGFVCFVCVLIKLDLCQTHTSLHRKQISFYQPWLSGEQYSIAKTSFHTPAFVFKWESIVTFFYFQTLGVIGCLKKPPKNRDTSNIPYTISCNVKLIAATWGQRLVYGMVCVMTMAYLSHYPAWDVRGKLETTLLPWHRERWK